MPWGLRLVTLCCLCWSLAIPFILVPLPIGYSYNGEEVSWFEFWRRGAGLIVFTIGCFAAVIAYGFIHARRWSRLLFVFSVTVFLVCNILASGSGRVATIVLSVFVIALVVWYFFYRKPVRVYFSGSHYATVA
jgi:hypothetical protein